MSYQLRKNYILIGVQIPKTYNEAMKKEIARLKFQGIKTNKNKIINELLSIKYK